MTTRLTKVPRPKFLLPLLCTLGLFATSQMFTINLTPSMPIGIYVKSFGAIQRGDIVAACLPDNYRALGLQEGYLHRGTKCFGSDPIIKEVIAVPGDDVVLKNESITVNEKMFSYPTKSSGSQGQKLNKYPRGDYQNTNGYWLIGTNDIEHSWDSRYWGPITKQGLLYKVSPLFNR